MAENAEVQDSSLSVDQGVSAFEALLAAENGDTQENSDAAVPEGDEADAEDPQAEEPEEQETEDEDEQQPVFTVKIDGKETQVAADELVKGYQRNADYTRKTQELAELRKTSTAELESAKAERAQYAERLKAYSEALQRTAPQEIDWDNLLNQNPHEFLKARLQYERHQQESARIEAERQALAERETVEQARQREEYLKTEAQKLEEAIPEWKKNPKQAKTEKAALVEFAKQAGYGPDELGQIADHRVVVLLRKAMLHDQMTAKLSTLKPTQQGPRTAQPGSAQPSGKTAFVQAQKRLAKTGSIDDAASVFLQHLA